MRSIRDAIKTLSVSFPSEGGQSISTTSNCLSLTIGFNASLSHVK